MSVGEDIGTKSVIDISGDKIEGIILQDLKTPDNILRQVIFESKYDQIQSEMQLVYRDPKKHDIPEHLIANSKEAPKKKGKIAVLNQDHLNNEYQQAMLAGMFMASNISKKPLNVLHLGTGAGIMPSFLRSQLGASLAKLTTIDNNADILKIAEKYYGFVTKDTQIESLNEDAFEWVNNQTDKGKYDVIIMDVNYQDDDTSISPPWKFLDTEFLNKLSALANPETAYLTFNILYYSEDSKKRVFEQFKGVKNIENSRLVQIEDGNNKVIMLSRNDKQKVDFKDPV